MATSLSGPISDTSGCVIFQRLSIAAVSGQPWENSQLNHLVFAFLVAARFADSIISLPPCQFARNTFRSFASFSMNCIASGEGSSASRRTLARSPPLAIAYRAFISSLRATWAFHRCIHTAQTPSDTMRKIAKTTSSGRFEFRGILFRLKSSPK